MGSGAQGKPAARKKARQGPVQDEAVQVPGVPGDSHGPAVKARQEIERVRRIDDIVLRIVDLLAELPADDTSAAMSRLNALMGVHDTIASPEIPATNETSAQVQKTWVADDLPPEISASVAWLKRQTGIPEDGIASRLGPYLEMHDVNHVAQALQTMQQDRPANEWDYLQSVLT